MDYLVSMLQNLRLTQGEKGTDNISGMERGKVRTSMNLIFLGESNMFFALFIENVEVW